MFQGAAEAVVERAKEEGDEDLLTQGGTALEVGISVLGREGAKVAHSRWLSSVARSDSSGVHRVRKSLVSSLSFSLCDM